jgi:hypothetical protein
MSQLDLFAPPQYICRGWKPDPMSADAYQAEWELLNQGTTARSVRAPLFRGTIDPWLGWITWMAARP